MTTIILKTSIQASCDVCFDLSRSIDLHVDSMNDFREKAVSGKVTGLIGLGETVTWRAKHFLVWHQMTSAITRYEYPTMFRDEMVKGPFNALRHDHIFSPFSGGTLMTDIFQYTLPWTPFTMLLDFLVFRKYMKRLLLQRNAVIKQLAEGRPTKKISATG